MAEARDSAKERELIESIGPWPFTTRRTYRLPDGSHAVWKSRHHRKRLTAGIHGEAASLGAMLLRSLWMPWHMSWWIGIVFAVGSSLFMIGSMASLAPSLARTWSLDSSAINAAFFGGSIPFTTAAYLQLFQAANADFSWQGARASRRAIWLGWRPHDIGWLSSALQFAGTLLFNLNTFDAMQPELDWLQQDLEIWIPDVAGSILFLVSGYLAFTETCHAYWAWKPASLSWWVTFINLLGCVAFMASAVLAFVWPHSIGSAPISVAFTFIGAICFFVGSLSMLPEAAIPSGG